MKIFFTGAEKINWALNEDLRLLQDTWGRENSAESVAAADTVFSVWWGGLADLDPQKLAGKRIICQFDNPPYHWFKQPGFRDAPSKVGLWIVQSEQARRQAAVLGLPHFYIPYKVDTTVFRFLEAGARAKIRSSLGIPAGDFVVGNFQRDTDGSDLSIPKAQKAPELFLEITLGLRALGIPVHALLAGPRRHWLRGQLEKNGIPCTYAGEKKSGDDIKINIIPRTRLAELYGVLDLCLITSRWEGGPYSLLEAAATGTPVLCTPVGMAEDLLDPASIFRDLDEGVRKAAEHARTRGLYALSQSYLTRVQATHTVASVQPLVRELGSRLETVPKYSPTARTPRASAPTSFWGRAIGVFRSGKRSGSLTVSLFREFVKPPYGGGNQFMLALKDSFQHRARVLVNAVSPEIDGYFFDSLWFDEKLLAKLKKLPSPIVVHRIDGPIHLYRGKDKEIDDKIFAVNAELATSTVIQSDFTLEKVFETGYRPVRPVVIRNAVNPSIFAPPPRLPPLTGRKVRIIASSWSDNPNKGGPVYKWLEENLDWSRFDFTFVGRCSESLAKAKVIPPVKSEELAKLLGEHDLYITASQNDPCSNALIEAMSCGLPALALRSGGHPELVGFGGLCFDRAEEIPHQLEVLVSRYDSFRRLVRPPSMAEVSEKYLTLVREP